MRCVLFATVVVLFVLGSGMTAPANAGEAQGAAIALHVAGGISTKAPPNGCPGLPTDETGAPLHCKDYRVQWPLGKPALVYMVVVAPAPGGTSLGGGISEVSTGIDYDASAIRNVTWFSCGDYESQVGWPSPGGGNRILWYPTTNCQDTVVYAGEWCWGKLWSTQAVAGSFYMTAYADDAFRVTPNTAVEPEEWYYVDCEDNQLDFMESEYTCAVGFGAAAGKTCDELVIPVAVDRTTWGRIKSRY